MSRPGDRPVLIHRLIARLNVGGPAMHVVNLAAAMNDGPLHQPAGRLQDARAPVSPLSAGTLGRIAAVLAGVPVRVHTYHGHVVGGSYFAPWKTAFFVFVEQQLGRLSDRLVAGRFSVARLTRDVTAVYEAEIK